MTLLSRKVGESLVIAGAYLITVLQIESTKAKIRLSGTPQHGRISFDEIVHEQSLARGESLAAAPNISCSIILITGDKVRLGITHPPSIEVHRKEIYDKLQGAA